MNINVSSSNWLNIIPDIQDMDVLKIGTQKSDNIISILYSNPKSLSCVGTSNDNIKTYVNNFFDNIDNVPYKCFDSIILDEPEYITEAKSIDSIKSIISKLSKSLKINGTIIICVPDTMFHIKYRHIVKAAFLSQKFDIIKYYLCDPSSDNPMTIVPFTGNSKWITRNLPNLNEKPFNFRSIIKSYIKYFLFTLTRIYYPYRDLIIVAQKSDNTESVFFSGFKDLKKITNNGTEIVKYEDIDLTYICMTATYLRQHYVFFYNKSNDDLVLITKIGYESSLEIDNMERDYSNLSIVSSCQNELDLRNIRVASPAYYNTTQDKSILVQTSVPGKSLGHIINKYFYKSDRDNIIRLLDELTNIHIYIQDVFSTKLEKNITRLSSDYYNNYNNYNIGFSNKDSFSFLRFIQHGDFAVNNIFFDSNSKEWGIIDWEWLSIGFPPLFDLFSLFTSIGFTKSKTHKSNIFDRYFVSFTDTFFDDNWFSKSLINFIKRYSKHHNLSLSDTYMYIIFFLLFHCNKYRKNNLPEYQNLYERMLTHTLNNKESFIFNKAQE